VLVIEANEMAVVGILITMPPPEVQGLKFVKAKVKAAEVDVTKDPGVMEAEPVGRGPAVMKLMVMALF
jgi:hypothetical protein